MPSTRMPPPPPRRRQHTRNFRLTVEVLPPALSSQYHHIAVNNTQATDRFALPVRLEDTFATVWKLIEDMYPRLYPHKAADFSIMKLQDGFAADLALDFRVAQIYETLAPTERVLHVYRASRDREMSILPSSGLRVRLNTKRELVDRSPPPAKRQRMNHVDPDDPLPTRELGFGEGRPSSDDPPPTSELGLEDEPESSDDLSPTPELGLEDERDSSDEHVVRSSKSSQIRRAPNNGRKALIRPELYDRGSDDEDWWDLADTSERKRCRSRQYMRVIRRTRRVSHAGVPMEFEDEIKGVSEHKSPSPELGDPGFADTTRSPTDQVHIVEHSAAPTSAQPAARRASNNVMNKSSNWPIKMATKGGGVFSSQLKTMKDYLARIANDAPDEIATVPSSAPLQFQAAKKLAPLDDDHDDHDDDSSSEDDSTKGTEDESPTRSMQHTATVSSN